MGSIMGAVGEIPTLATPTRELAVECLGLSKAYTGRLPALDDVTLAVARGESFALLGENGAGKSTLVRLLLGFLLPTAGTVRLFGQERLLAAHPRVGYVHEHPLFEARFTGREYLTYLGQVAGSWGRANRARANAVLEQVELLGAASKRVGAYSKGTLQRLAIAAALLSDPDLLILDEPTSGLDPASQYAVRRILGELHARGKTLLICSHYLAEVEQLCTSVAILRRGRVVAQGPVAELTRGDELVEIVLAGEESAADVVSRLGLSDAVRDTSERMLHIPSAAQPPVLAALVGAGIPLRSLHPVARTLEDVYLRAARLQPGREPNWVDQAAGPSQDASENDGGSK
jgi:ABC-2 type transport system ATP-binding protein